MRFFGGFSQYLAETRRFMHETSLPLLARNSALQRKVKDAPHPTPNLGILPNTLYVPPERSEAWLRAGFC